MMLITQATRFVGAQLIKTLNQHNFKYLVAVDDELVSFPPAFVSINLQRRLLSNELEGWLSENHAELEGIFHLDEQETTSGEHHFRLLWRASVDHQIPFIFRATPSRTAWIEQQASAPFFWAGLSWNHSFGPGDEGWVPRAYKLLAQGSPPTSEVTEERSLVYSRNIAAACYFLIRHRQHSGVYSLDSASPISYEQIATWVKQAYENPNDSPQVSTASPPHSLQDIGLRTSFFPPEAGVYDYVQNYLRGQES